MALHVKGPPWGKSRFSPGNKLADPTRRIFPAPAPGPPGLDAGAAIRPSARVPPSSPLGEMASD